MAVHVPPAFAVDDRQALDALIDAHPFATLVTPSGDEVMVTHLPLVRESERALVGHFARGNPHASAGPAGVSLAIFHGPHAYISPTWYEAPGQAVPTWNFAAVHARGTIEPLAGNAAEQVLEMLVERFEGTGPSAWRFALRGRAREAMVDGIAAFRFRIESLTGKFKLSQNRPAGDRRRVIAALAAAPHAESRATAAWMRDWAPPDDDLDTH